MSQEASRRAGSFYPRDSAGARYHRDVDFYHLVSMLEAFLQKHEFSPSELREAVILAATRHEMRICRPMFALSDGEIREFLSRTERDPKGEQELDRLKYIEAIMENPEMAAEMLKNHKERP